MKTCSVCEKEFEDKYFDVEQNKCILHCEKNDWLESDKRIDYFWDKIKEDISKLHVDRNSLNDKGIDTSSLNEDTNGKYIMYKFHKVIFPMYKEVKGHLPHSEFKSDLNIEYIECTFLDKTDFTSLKKAKNISFKSCEFYENIEFKDMVFEHRFFFENCTVHKNINLSNIIFKEITSFRDSKFYEEMNFENSKFDDLAIFNNVTVENLLLDNTFFRVEYNFLNMKANLQNRETARIIKDSFEKQNNIIEANRFYALEMQEREKELKFLDNPVEWIIFKTHGLSSEHSQSAYLALLWILNISYIFSVFCAGNNTYNSIIVLSSITIILFSMIDIKYALKIGLTISGLELLLFTNIKLDTIADKINPFSIMSSWDEIPFDLLIFKITIAYLIYQFIISVRQNTRRK